MDIRESLKPNFNSHAHAGRDADWVNQMTSSGNFNSHAHAGRDNATHERRFVHVNFNSHAHAGRDSLKITFQGEL